MNTKRETSDALLPFSTQGDVVENRGGGLCGCFSDMSTCLWGYCCPCYLFGRTLARSGATKRTWSGCVMYLLVALFTSMLALLVVLGFLGRLDKYANCVENQRVVPDPADGSSSDSDGDLQDSAQSWAPTSRGWDARTEGALLGSIMDDVAPICTENGYCATGECRPVGGCCVNECEGENIACPYCHQYTAAPAAEADDACSSLLSTALSWYYARIWLVNMEALVVAGLLCGYYRERIKIALGGAGSTLSCRSFLLHCLPCTHLCALCQEARAVGDPEQNYGGQPGLSI